MRGNGKEGRGREESPAFAGCNQLPRGQLVTKVNRRRNVRRGLYVSWNSKVSFHSGVPPSFLSSPSHGTHDAIRTHCAFVNIPSIYLGGSYSPLSLSIPGRGIRKSRTTVQGRERIFLILRPMPRSGDGIIEKHAFS